MHRNAIIFMSLINMFMVLEVDGRRAAGFRIIRNPWDCHHFHVFGSGWEGREWHQKRIKAVSIFMVLEVGGRGRLAPESYEMHWTVLIFERLALES